MPTVETDGLERDGCTNEARIVIEVGDDRKERLANGLHKHARKRNSGAPARDHRLQRDVVAEEGQGRALHVFLENLPRRFGVGELKL